MTIDERLRAAADELKVQPAGPVPELPARSRSVRMLAMWTVVALLVGGGIWAIGERGNTAGDTGPVSVDTGPLSSLEPVTSTAVTAPPPTEAPTTSIIDATTDVPVTEPTSADLPRRLALEELGQWFGTFTMEPQTVDAVLGTTGTITWVLATTPSSFCIRRVDGGSGCSFRGDGSNMFDEPQTLPQIGMNVRHADGRWALDILAPLDVQLRLISNGTPPCELQPFTLQPYADAALWACESTSPAPMWYTIEGVRGDDRVVFDRVSSWKPDVHSREQMLAEMFGAKCLEGAAGQPVNFVPRTIELEQIPSPIEETGVRIGPMAGQDIPVRHPSEAEYWVAVSIGDEIVGYSYVPNGDLDVAPEELDLDCHPEIAIYDEHGELIGGFYNGPAAIIDRL